MSIPRSRSPRSSSVQPSGGPSAHSSASLSRQPEYRSSRPTNGPTRSSRRPPRTWVAPSRVKQNPNLSWDSFRWARARPARTPERGPGPVNWVAVVVLSREHGAAIKQHRADMFIDLDADPREGRTSLGGERATLLEFLRCQRLRLAIKCEGLDAAQLARRAVELSTMSLLGRYDIWQRSNAGGFADGSPAGTWPGDTSPTPIPTATSTVPNPIRGS